MDALAEKIINKLTSGRFIVTIALTTTISYMLIQQIPIPDVIVTAYVTDIILYYFKNEKKEEQ